ncbi:MAG: glycoside hydrolase family 97 catalytic domain-containing protein [Bacteroidaceae bacterium]|nr:glycoside hydrolase family 97 catalytic domain-containing protein [Bacteroidaceae bacterium]
MKHHLLFAALVAAMTVPLGAQENAPATFRVKSPDGLTYADITVANGRATYTAGYRVPKGKKDTTDIQMLEPSPLGIVTDVADFSQKLKLEKAEPSHQAIGNSYNLRQGKRSHIDYTENMLVLTFSQPDAAKSGVQMRIIFRVSNDNIAFNYNFVQTGETSALVVQSEATGFRFPKGTTAFICPQSDPMIGWKRSKPSYEEEYIWDEPITTRSRYGQGWTFPCLFHEGDKGWVLVSETGVTSEYCACHLADATEDGLFQIAFPMQGENNGFGSTGAQIGLAQGGKTAHRGNMFGRTPYRTITMGRTLKPIVETTIAWDVVPQLYEPSKEYQGSRNTWSWIIWQDPSINYDDQVKFIDLAASLGWEGCLIDGGWLQNIGRERMEKLFAYAKKKGVNPWVWYNSNGGWNDAPQCARQSMHNPIVRKHEMRWLQRHGVAGIKVDFFAGDKQETMRLYEGILSDANDFGIQVIFHGCTLPRGWERMYPNYCSSEAVLASENLVFSQGFCEMEARHACLHPFVRNTVASMEYGGTVLQKRLNKGNDGGSTRRTSDVFELATAVAFQSCGQNFALTPRDLEEQPAFEIEFMRQVPTTWDDTRFIEGFPGKYIVLARRHADRWYIVAMNAEEKAKQLNIDLKSALGDAALGATFTYLHDGKDGKSPQQSTLKTDKKGCALLTIQPQCAGILISAVP